LLTDLYRAGERPFAPVFTLNDVLAGFTGLRAKEIRVT
jgi:hypothetical protein